MKFTQPRILSKILLGYSIILSFALLPFAQKNGSWEVYSIIVALAFVLTFVMFWVAKKQQ